MRLGYSQITKFTFRRSALQKAYDFMKKIGEEDHCEAVVLFAGNVFDTEALIEHVVVPKQIAENLDGGLLYSVEAEELYRVSLDLYKKNLDLLAQIHTHPGRAYHSDTDDRFPIVTTLGGLSIVVPNFASKPMDHSKWAYYRLMKGGIWEEVRPAEREKLIAVQ